MRISVIKPFTFNDKGELTRYEIGSHNVSDEVGNHPFTLAHCGDQPEGTSEDAAEMMAQLQEAGRVLLDMRNQLDAARHDAVTLATANGELQGKLDTANEQVVVAEGVIADLQGKLTAATTEAAQTVEAMTTLATANADLQKQLEAAQAKKKA